MVLDTKNRMVDIGAMGHISIDVFSLPNNQMSSLQSYGSSLSISYVITSEAILEQKKAKIYIGSTHGNCIYIMAKFNDTDVNIKMKKLVSKYMN